MRRILYKWLLITWLRITQSLWTTCEIIGGENSKKGLIVTSFKWGRFNRTTYVANGFYNITEDFSNAYEVEIKVFYSSKGNSQLRLLFIGVPRTPLCEYLDGHMYRTIIQPDYEAHSNLPKATPGESLCRAYKKGSYTFRNWPMNGRTIVPSYLNPGYFEVHMFYYKRESNLINCKRTYKVRLT